MQLTLASDPIQIALASPTLAKIYTMAEKSTGISLVVLRRRGDALLRLNPSGVEAPLPVFCQIIRASEGGRERCAACRSLVVLGACYRGLTDYCCHGGMSVVAAPVPGDDNDAEGRLVVSSCAFADADTERGWRSLRRHAHGLPVDMEQLRKAYERLPVLTEEKLALARWLVDAAASAIAEARDYAVMRMNASGSLPVEKSPSKDTAPVLKRDIAEALRLSRDLSFKGERPTGAMLIDMVVAMVSRDPSIAFTVGDVAKAARMTPNHFSTLFRRHTGITFVEFLAARRVALGQELLRDPTLSVGEVARRVGFGDASYFSRRFRKLVGATPREWRETSGIL